MDAIREEFEFDEHNSHGYRTSGAINGYTDGDGREDFSDVAEIKQNVRNAMKEARRKITSLRLDVEEKENMLQTERALRQQLEKELTEKSEELYRERMNKSIVGSPNRSPLSGSTSRHYNNSVNSSSLGDSPNHTLKEELSTSHQLNIQLTEKLARAEAEIQAFKMSREEIIGHTEAKIAARGAALVDKIYHAQKERDDAMNARLRLARDEKEELINRLRRLEREQTGFDSGVDSVYDDEDPEANLKNLLHKLAASESPQTIDKQGAMMVSRIKSVQKNKKRVVTEELRAVLAERDAAVEKARKLEADVVQLQKELDMIKNQFKLAEKTRIKAAQAQLMSAQHERDTSLKKTKRLEEELETIRVYYSLHRSLSQEQNLRDQFNQTMDSFEVRLRQRDGEMQVAQKTYDEVVAKLKSVTQERTILSSQLQEAIKSQRQEKEKADKLERLVGVLRKRVSQTGGGTITTVN